MATANINKIVRGNLGFKPWIASKNTTEIVNSYVQKFYQQIPNNFKNDLLKPRLIASKTENRVPLRKIVPEKFNIPIISNKPTSKLRSNGYRSPAITRKNSFITSPKNKLLKIPNFKIYTKRRYASSVSSSKSSFVRNKINNNEEYRRKIYKPLQGIQNLRGTEAFLPNVNYYKHSVKTVNVSNAICNDLMSINDVLKKKICPIKQKVPDVEPLEAPKQDLWELSLKGWNHPSKEHYSKLTTIPFIKMPQKTINGSFESGPSSFRLMPVTRKPYAGKFSNLSSAPKKVNARLQSSNSSRYKGFSLMPGANQTKGTDRYQSLGTTFNSLMSAAPTSKEKTCNLKDALDFVCLSRAERGLRSKNLREFRF